MNQEIIITSLFWLMLAGNTLWAVAYYRERDKRIAQEKKFISAMTSKEPALEKSESQIYGEAMEELP